MSIQSPLHRRRLGATHTALTSRHRPNRTARRSSIPWVWSRGCLKNLASPRSLIESPRTSRPCGLSPRPCGQGDGPQRLGLRQPPALPRAAFLSEQAPLSPQRSGHGSQSSQGCHARPCSGYALRLGGPARYSRIAAPAATRLGLAPTVTPLRAPASMSMAGITARSPPTTTLCPSPGAKAGSAARPEPREVGVDRRAPRRYPGAEAAAEWQEP